MKAWLPHITGLLEDMASKEQVPSLCLGSSGAGKKEQVRHGRRRESERVRERKEMMRGNTIKIRCDMDSQSG